MCSLHKTVCFSFKKDNELTLNFHLAEKPSFRACCKRAISTQSYTYDWVNNIMPYSVPMKIGCFERREGGGGMPKPNEKETTNPKCWILSLSYEYFQGVESQDSKFIFGVFQRNTPWQRTSITKVWKGSVIKVLEFTRIGKLFMFRIFTVEEANVLLLKL